MTHFGIADNQLPDVETRALLSVHQLHLKLSVALSALLRTVHSKHLHTCIYMENSYSLSFSIDSICSILL